MNVDLPFLDAAAVHAHLPWPRMIEALHDALRADVTAPLRTPHRIDVPDGPAATLLTMPAWQTGKRLGVKLVTVFPGNAARGMGAVSAVYLLFDATTGVPLAVLDGDALTARRTAGASAYAARALAREDARHLVMVGAGRQARGLVEAHAGVRDLACITVWSRREAHARALVEALRADGLPARVTTALEQAVREADIVSCATLATMPLVCGDWLAPGTHLDLVGAFRRDMRETDDAAMARADLVVVDDREAALAEGGDVVQAIASGALPMNRIAADLRDLARGRHPGRTQREAITVFKSVGFALEDLAAAGAVWEAWNDRTAR